jgi:hypothetical protein
MVIKLSSYQVIKGECVPQGGGWAEEWFERYRWTDEVCAMQLPVFGL